ncbi:T9SS type A sorting domain-containing protein [Hymenobacter koreensis]|uniref:Secretion system C-terminal sorting domain-containing protein n=1 Tax=Hymenobacter koreensis TaxID=1084523 RepID=A0ABP8IZ60_9BACT
MDQPVYITQNLNASDFGDKRTHLLWQQLRALPAIWRPLLLITSLFYLSHSSLAQDPGRGGTAAGFEVDADFEAGFIPPFWTNANYSPNRSATAADWSKNRDGSGTAVLKQIGGVSAVGRSDDGRALWQVDGNWGTQSAVVELSTFSGSSNKNGDAIGPGQSPYSVQLGGGGPQKNDITNTFLHARVVNGQTWLFFGAETRAVNGASYLDFEYNQAGLRIVGNQLVGVANSNAVSPARINGRTVNDFLLVINYTGGGNRPEVGVRTWQANGTWSNEQPLATGNAFMTTNPADVRPVAPNKSFTGEGAYANVTGALQFVEGAVNISAVPGLAALNQCSPLATVTVKTRSSPSYTSELKDFDILTFSLAPTPTAAVTTAAPQCLPAGGSAVFQVSGTYTGGTPAWSASGGTLSNEQYSNGTATATVTVAGATTATVTLTTTTSVGGATCSSAADTENLVVKPTPGVDPVTPRIHCAGDAGSAINFTSSVNGATFSWTSSVDVGFGTSGSGAISAYTAANATTAPVATTVTVTATADGCQGPPSTFTVTVNPRPATNAIGNRNHCTGESGAAVTFSSPVAGATFGWTSSVDVGFGTSGSGNIGAYTAANATAAPLVATVTVTATAAGCQGPARTFTVTVNPVAAAPSVTYNAPACNESTFSVTVNGPQQGSYTLTRLGHSPITLVRAAGATGPLVFTGLAAGSGYSVSFTNPSGCTSNANECGSAGRSAADVQSQLVPQPQRSIETEAFPNPTTSDATINFSVPKTGRVMVQVYDAMGRPVTTLFNGEVLADETKSVVLKGAALGSGTYYYRVTADGKTKTNRISLVK